MTDPCGTPFLRRLKLLREPLPVVRVKLRFQTSSVMKDTMCLSGSQIKFIYAIKQNTEHTNL